MFAVSSTRVLLCGGYGWRGAVTLNGRIIARLRARSEADLWCKAWSAVERQMTRKGR